MAYGDPEIIWTPCPAFGCPDVFTAVAPPGAREQPLYPVCCRCGRERDDLAGFYGDPPAASTGPGCDGCSNIASSSITPHGVASINGDK